MDIPPQPSITSTMSQISVYCQVSTATVRIRVGQCLPIFGKQLTVLLSTQQWRGNDVHEMHNSSSSPTQSI